MDNELVALPFCDGPKLLPFKLRQTHDIELIKVIRIGLHSVVFKVKIGQEMYALKIFDFISDKSQVDSIDNSIDDREAWAVVGQYDLPFNAECRAYGRLKETGNEDLAVQCHGYITLTEDQIEEVSKHGRQGRPLGAFRECWSAADGTPAPMRALVKDLGELTEPSLQFGLGAFETVKKLHQLGIFNVDVRIQQFINGKMCGFGMARTLPHYSANPELNPLLPADWVPICADNTWLLCRSDYHDLFRMAFFWVSDGYIENEAEAGQVEQQLLNPLRRLVYGNENARIGSVHTVPCDPRNGPWKQHKRSTARRNTSSSSSHNSNNSNKVTKLRLSKHPKRWEMDTKARKALEWINCAPFGGVYSWRWYYDNASGFVFPKGELKMLKVINGKVEVCDAEPSFSTIAKRAIFGKIHPELVPRDSEILDPNVKQVVCAMSFDMHCKLFPPHNPLEMDRPAASRKAHTEYDDMLDKIVRKLIEETLGYKPGEYHIFCPLVRN